jgi:hypothetical protein
MIGRLNPDSVRLLPTNHIKRRSIMNEGNVNYRDSNHTLAIVSLVLSILGLVGILPLAGSIGGIITGNIARREIRERPHLYSSDGLAQAGIVLGWVGLALILLVCCIILFALVPFFGLSIASVRQF